MFRRHIDEAVAVAGDPQAPPQRTGGPPRALLFPQVIVHLLRGYPPPREPSPLLAELTVADVEALGSGQGSGLEQWLPLMGVTGPWPDAVPELERMLEGNKAGPAAMALSHLRHPRALEVLLENGDAFGHTLPTLAHAIARYWAQGVVPWIERMASPAGDDHLSRYRQQAARRLLAQLVINHPDLVRQVSKDERFGREAALAVVKPLADEGLEQARWVVRQAAGPGDGRSARAQPAPGATSTGPSSRTSRGSAR